MIGEEHINHSDNMRNNFFTILEELDTGGNSRIHDSFTARTPEDAWKQFKDSSRGKRLLDSGKFGIFHVIIMRMDISIF